MVITITFTVMMIITIKKTTNTKTRTDYDANAIRITEIANLALSNHSFSFTCFLSNISNTI